MKNLAVFIFATFTLVSCGDAPNKSKKPPFKVRYANLALQIPDRADLYQATNYDFGLYVNICDRHAKTKPVRFCEELPSPIVSEHGVRTSVTEPRPEIRFTLLKERPENMSPPDAVPLVVIPESEIDRDIRGSGEAYQLSRVRYLGSEQMVTTMHGWPIASCATHDLGNRHCVVGFLISGAFIEARWFADKNVLLNQAEVWVVASSIDARLRSLSVQISPVEVP